MSTTYRVVVHCDEQGGAACHGLLEFSAPHPRHISSTHQRVVERGWLRGYRAEDTYDVCPSCRPAVDAHLARADADERAPEGDA